VRSFVRAGEHRVDSIDADRRHHEVDDVVLLQQQRRSRDPS
jgi:hypothetical protein